FSSSHTPSPIPRRSNNELMFVAAGTTRDSGATEICNIPVEVSRRQLRTVPHVLAMSAPKSSEYLGGNVSRIHLHFRKSLLAFGKLHDLSQRRIRIRHTRTINGKGGDQGFRK